MTPRRASLAPDGVDRIVEVALHRNIDLDSAVVAPGGAIAAYATGGRTSLDLAAIMPRNVVVHSVLVYTMPQEALHQAIADVSRALEEGALGELPEHRYPLERIADAHDAVEAGAVGKVLVEPG